MIDIAQLNEMIKDFDSVKTQFEFAVEPLRAEIEKLEREIEDIKEADFRDLEEKEAAIKSAVLELKTPAIGKFFRWSYGKPATRWDTKKLNDYAQDHPSVLVFQKQSAPTVRKTKVK